VRSITSRSVAETIELGRRLGTALRPGDAVVLAGDLGAGKTHFTKGVAAALGVSDEIISPTFNIMLESVGTGEGAGTDSDIDSGLKLYHWDLYRIDDVVSLTRDLDYFELLETRDGVFLVEWGDKFAEVQERADLELVFRYVGEEERTIEVRALSERGIELAMVLCG